MSSAAALLSYLGLLSDESNFGRYTLKTHDLSEYLRLDHAALRALNLFPDLRGPVANKNASLFGLLNRCKTAQGVRMLSQWIKQPLVHVHAIQNRQALLQTFLDEADARQRLQEHFLKWMPDMLRISKRFQRGVATLEDVVRNLLRFLCHRRLTASSFTARLWPRLTSCSTICPSLLRWLK